MAGGVLLAGCILAFRKRAGIVLFHAGVILMMVNELFVGLKTKAISSTAPPKPRCNCRVGEVHDYVEDIRSAEFAVIDPSNPKTDSVTVVPRVILLAGARSATINCRSISSW